MTVQDNLMAVWLAEHALGVSLGVIGIAMLLAYGITSWVENDLPRRRTRMLYSAAVLGGGVFAVIVWALMGPDGALERFDDALAVALAGTLTPGVLYALSLFTHFGERDLLAGFAALVLLILLFRRQWALAMLWFAATAGGGLLNRMLKAGFERARPAFDHGFVQTHSFSFPSGHATGAMACYGMLAFLLMRVAPAAWRPAIAASLLGLIAAVGLSRVLLHVHFASDVLAGWAVTAAWIALCIQGYHAFREKSLQV